MSEEDFNAQSGARVSDNYVVVNEDGGDKRMLFDMAAAGIKEIRAMAGSPGKGNTGTGTGTVLDVQEKDQTEQPPMYKVVMHDDDRTSFEFVAELLMKFFEGMTEDHAWSLTMEVHNNPEDMVVVAVYEKNRAVEKVQTVNDYCRTQGQIFTMTCEPE